MEFQEAVGFFDEEIDIHEGVGGNVGPEDAAFSVDHEGAVEWLVLEVIVGGVGFEDVLFFIGDEREGDGSFFVVVL